MSVGYTRYTVSYLFYIFTPRPVQLHIGKEIGRGSYGEILEGTLGTRPVAIKRLHRMLRDFAAQTQEALEAILGSFRRECELLEKARSPHIVEFFGVFDEEDTILLVMELMHQTLQTYLKDHKGSLPLEKQVDICYQVSQEGTIPSGDLRIIRSKTRSNFLIAQRNRPLLPLRYARRCQPDVSIKPSWWYEQNYEMLFISSCVWLVTPATFRDA